MAARDSNDSVHLEVDCDIVQSEIDDLNAWKDIQILGIGCYMLMSDSELKKKEKIAYTKCRVQRCVHTTDRSHWGCTALRAHADLSASYLYHTGTWCRYVRSFIRFLFFFALIFVTFFALGLFDLFRVTVFAFAENTFRYTFVAWARDLLAIAFRTFLRLFVGFFSHRRSSFGRIEPKTRLKCEIHAYCTT